MNHEVDHTKGRMMYRNMEEEMERKETTKSLTLGFTALTFLLDVQMRLSRETLRNGCVKHKREAETGKINEERRTILVIST